MSQTTLWFDTADVSFIQKHNPKMPSDGVTTNPSILSKNPQPVTDIVQSLLQAQSGWVALQVTAPDADGMIAQAQALRSLSDRIVVKVPVEPAGLAAMKELKRLNIPALATTILTTAQVVLAAQAGAKYAAFYLKCIPEYEMEIRKMQATVSALSLDIELMGAAIDTVEQMNLCVGLGIPTATLPSDTLEAYLPQQHQAPAFGSLIKAEDAELVKAYLNIDASALKQLLESELAAVLPDVNTYLDAFSKTWNNGPHKAESLFALEAAA